MGIPLPDPARADSVGSFIQELRLLKVWTGDPPLRRLSRDSGLARSTLCDLLSPRRRRLPSLDLVLRYIQACGVTGERMAAWRAAWCDVQASGAARPAEPARDAVVPRQLPAAAAHLVGRDEEMRTLDQLAEDGGFGTGRARLALITGMPGIGKTALAVAWAQRSAHLYPDGQLHVNLHGTDPAMSPVAAGAVLRGFLDSLAVPSRRIPADMEAQAALYRSLVAGRRLLVVLDDAASVAQVRPLLPGDSTCLTLVASRTQFPGLVVAEGARPLLLGLLTAGDARRLLEGHLGARRVAAEPEAARELVDRCAGLPLALMSAAARAAHHPALALAELAADLLDAPGYRRPGNQPAYGILPAHQAVDDGAQRPGSPARLPPGHGCCCAT